MAKVFGIVNNNNYIMLTLQMYIFLMSSLSNGSFLVKISLLFYSFFKFTAKVDSFESFVYLQYSTEIYTYIHRTMQ